MDRFANSILHHRKAIVTFFFTVAIFCTVMQFFVTVNYNLTDYLPENAQSTQALELMEKEFSGGIPNARVMVRSVSVQQALDYKARLSAIEGVTDVIWLDTAADLKIPIEMLDAATVENYYRDETALFTVTIASGYEVSATDKIYELIGENGAISGDAVNTATAQKMAGSESLNAMLILVPMIVLILLISTSSWAEPVFFLMAIGISVLINLGTNLFFGQVSFVTQAISPILQLAVSLDYAIFLLHSFEDYRHQTSDVQEAMRLAMKRSFPAIAASAATTLFGFLALTFMQFGIGVNLGLNLVKGILLSFVSVMVFLPAATLCFYRLIDKTRHKVLLPKFKGIPKLVSKIKVPCLILVAVLLIPSFMAQSHSNFIYGMGDLSPNSRSGQDTAVIDKIFGKSTAIVLLVPKGHPARELALSQDLEELEHVTGVVTYANMVGTSIPVGYLDPEITKQFYSDNYCRIILYTNTETEGEAAFSVVEQVQAKAAHYYGDAVYSCGESVNLYDMKNTITQDNQMVNLIAIAAIAAVLLVTFRSLTLPLILLLTIETAIWINLSVPYFTGTALCYVGYLVINTVQLGATVDYAILLSEGYTVYRTRMRAKEALHSTLVEHFSSILVSASILSIAGFCLYFTSSNPIVSQLGLLLGRGTLLSFVLVIGFLPAMLLIFDRPIAKTTWKSNYHKEESK